LNHGVTAAWPFGHCLAEPFVILEPVEKVWSDGAVMGGLVNLKGISGGKPFAVTLRFVDV
jgi:hypothetical protein